LFKRIRSHPIFMSMSSLVYQPEFRNKSPAEIFEAF
jgi:hypothetical protein